MNGEEGLIGVISGVPSETQDCEHEWKYEGEGKLPNFEAFYFALRCRSCGAKGMIASNVTFNELPDDWKKRYTP
jgi:hypothetical protein